MADTNTIREQGMRLFVPITRPFLAELPDQVAAGEFLKKYKRYTQEVSHQRRNGEANADEVAEPVQVCIEPELLEFLVLYEDGIEADEWGGVSDEILLRWLKALHGKEDRRTLAQVIMQVRWPVVVVDQTLSHQTMSFMRSCHEKLVVDSDALERFGDNDGRADAVCHDALHSVARW